MANPLLGFAAAARLLPAPVRRGLADARLLLDLQSEKDYWLGTYARPA
ncbi:MAG: hypothetical protein KIT07_08340 [Anaerolineales bacterium]|nr:hypothetical protein [Anaerolineales bacterium]MCW5838775.1 hypothetical protein [Anaerolineales bacterium]MCW5888117.1 hypothetical protein [Anaerolineales bacterium]